MVSFRPHICAGLSGRAGAAARTTMLGCMFQRETPDALKEQTNPQDWLAVLVSGVRLFCPQRIS